MTPFLRQQSKYMSSSAIILSPRRSTAASTLSSAHCTTITDTGAAAAAVQREGGVEMGHSSRSTSIAGYMMSSPFSSKGRNLQAVEQSLLLTSPSRWQQQQQQEQQQQHQPVESLQSLHGGTTRDSTQYQEGTCHTTGMASSYMKEYNYTAPSASVQLRVNNPKTTKSVNPVIVAPNGTRSAPKHAIVKRDLHQQRFSGQKKLQEANAAMNAAATSSSPRQLLYQGLPYTWRELVPFDCPVRYPELMSYDPCSYHSVVAKQTSDSGMRLVDLTKGRFHKSLEALDLNVERGVTGVSLRKHSLAYRMQQVQTYPGISFGLAR